MQDDRSAAGETVGGAPARQLRPWVGAVHGYREAISGPLRRREVPHPHVVLILDFRPTLRFLDPYERTLAARYAGGCVAGLHRRHGLTETEGRQAGI